MNGQCAICWANFQSSDELCSPLCGHVYHYRCLFEWLQRSQTCPECRGLTYWNQVHRLYIRTEENENSSPTNDVLAVFQERLNNLEFEVEMKDLDLNHYKNRADELQGKVNELKEEITSKEVRLTKLQSHNDYLIGFAVENETLKNDNLRLRKQLEEKDKKLKVALIQKNISDGIDEMRSKLNNYLTHKGGCSTEPGSSNQHQGIEIPTITIDDTDESNENPTLCRSKKYNLRRPKGN